MDPLFNYSAEQRRTLDKYIQHDRKPDEQLNFSDFAERRCSAGRNYMNIAPNGDAYTCASGLSYIYSTEFRHVAGETDLSGYRLGNILDPAFSLNQADVTCTLPCTAACNRDAAIIRPVERHDVAVTHPRPLPGHAARTIAKPA